MALWVLFQTNFLSLEISFTQRGKMQLSQRKMQQKQYSLGFFTTTLLVVLTSQSSFAFTITPPQPGASITYDPSEEYILPDGRQGVTTLDPLSVTSIARGGTAAFLATLKAAFPAWNFNKAANDLAGSFDVEVYDALGTPSTVGADFRLQYNPAGGDPTPANNELHWIQRVVNNHKLGAPHGTLDDKIDIVPSQDNPFYDTFGDADEDSFHDFPKRFDADKNHFWFADLYLVELTAPQTVTIYNGVRWGWTNTVPEPSSVLGLLALGTLGAASTL
ncbi:MAG: hypothetical protein ACK52F_00325, partial [bacterium]